VIQRRQTDRKIIPHWVKTYNPLLTQETTHWRHNCRHQDHQELRIKIQELRKNKIQELRFKIQELRFKIQELRYKIPIKIRIQDQAIQTKHRRYKVILLKRQAIADMV